MSVIQAFTVKPTTPVERDNIYWQLGASLYFPAIRNDLLTLMNGRSLHKLRSLVVCTEDAILCHELPHALDNLREILPRLLPSKCRRFIRPRSPEALKEILAIPGIHHIDGFVLPKVDEDRWWRYQDALSYSSQHFALMPTVETEVAFSRQRLERLRDLFLESPYPIVCLRIGGNDLMQLLGLKRPSHLTLYDTPLRTVINDMIVTFRPAGLELSSCVYEYIDNLDVLRKEVELDVVHGLYAKTAIHPTQLHVIESAYSVSASEAELADQVMKEGMPAVHKVHGQMIERATHSVWAQRTQMRRTHYGVSMHVD